MGRRKEFDVDVVLDAAMVVFWRDGYTRAAIGDICEATGLKTGSVYLTFGSKRGLFLAVIERYLIQINQPGIEKMSSAGTGIQGVKAYFDYIVFGIQSGNRQWGCLGTNAFIELGESDNDISRIMTTHFARLEDAFEQALSRDGIAGSHWPQHLVCLAQGINVLARIKTSKENLPSIVDTTILALTRQVDENVLATV